LWEVDALPESELEEWRGYFMYQGECCPSCSVHPANFMEYDMEDFICAVCGETTKRVAPHRDRNHDED
jgi:hypothetical protein